MNVAPSVLLVLASTLLGLTAAQAAVPVYRNSVLADGAIAYYEFDEISGTTAADTAVSLGGVNNGTLVGGVSLNQATGLPGLNTSYGFDGTGRVRIPDNVAFDLGSGAFSVELWFRTATEARGDLFTYKGSGGDFGIHSNSQADPAGFNAGVSVYFNNFAPFSPVGANLSLWHHVALTRASNGLMSIYIDGDLRGATTNSGTWNIANDILIGANHDGNPSNILLSYIGQIDEVAIYGSALTEAQLDNHIALASVPEPASASMLLLGAAGLAARRRPVRR